MKNIRLSFLLLLIVPGDGLFAAPLGTAFTYQGRLTDGANPANGIYHFMFELFDAPVGGTLLNDNEREDLTVSNGLFTVVLDFGPTAFTGNARWLQTKVQTNNGGGFTIVSPRQQIFPAPYALFSPTAGGVTNGAITSAALANEAVTTAKLADGSVTSAKLASGTVVTNILAGTNNLALGTSSLDGRLDVYRTGVGTPAIQLLGLNNTLRIFSDDGLEKSRIDASPGWGQLQLNNNSSVGQRAAILTANATGGGSLTLYSSNGTQRALLWGANGGGELDLNGSDGLEKVRLGTGSNLGSLTLNNNVGSPGLVCAANFLNGGGFLVLNNINGQNRVALDGGSSGGKMNLYNSVGTLSVDVRSQFSAGNTAAWVGLNDNGSERISFAARNGSTGVGGLIGVKNGTAGNTILMTGDTGGGHSKIGMFNASGVEVIQLHASHTAGKGRIVTPVLEITAGADLSEQFDVTSKDTTVQPGMVVCIDPQNPGKLVMSSKVYDRTVAGIVSGAGGVSPGMLMGQQGSVADGKHPIALSGRVYCLGDASNGAIEPGDLLTTSDNPGHSMKVTDHVKAQGAIIGKAMTALESGKGLVLVLVSLQ